MKHFHFVFGIAAVIVFLLTGQYMAIYQGHLRGMADMPDDAAPLDAALLLEERDAALWRAFERISDRCQSLLRVLMASPPPSYLEVSAALDMPIGSIGPTRQRCLEHLRRVVVADGALVDPSATEGGA